MADLRALLYDASIRHMPNPHPEREFPMALPTLPLATRLPQCVPAGLEWVDTHWGYRVGVSGSLSSATISRGQAETLFMGQAMRVLACDPRPMPRDIEEFAVALHKLADEMGV